MPKNKLIQQQIQFVKDKAKRRRIKGVAVRRLKKCAKQSQKRITLQSFREALGTSGGVKEIIALNLKVSRSEVQDFLSQDNEDGVEARRMYTEESEKFIDSAETTIQYLIKQRLDFAEAGRTARWYLERKAIERGYKDNRTVKIEGGQPIQIQQNVLNVDVLNLPLELRTQLLEQLERKQTEILEPTTIESKEDEE